MTDLGHPHPTHRAPPRRVLEDASGRRLRRLRWVGRATALLFLLWFAVVILGGLGVGPAGRLPLGNVLRPSAGPSPVRQIPRPVAPAPADLEPALPAPASERATDSPGDTAPGKSASAPGHNTTTSPGRSGAAPGHQRTVPPGKSGAAPGQARRTTTVPTTTMKKKP